MSGDAIRKGSILLNNRNIVNEYLKLEKHAAKSLHTSSVMVANASEKNVNILRKRFLLHQAIMTPFPMLFYLPADIYTWHPALHLYRSLRFHKD